MKKMQKNVLLLAGILASLSSQGMQAQEFLGNLAAQAGDSAGKAETALVSGLAGVYVGVPEAALQAGTLEGEQDEQDLTRSGQQLNNIWRRVNKIPNIAQADQVITQQEITAGPVIIVKPGVYHVAENVTFSNTVAIIIASDDIVLDLTGHSIDGQNSGGVAIQINAGYKNVTIQNGSIKRCICAGIFADGSAQPKEQSPYESITIKNILISDLGLCEIESTNPNEVLSILDDLSENSAFDAAIESGLGGQIDLLARAAGIFIDCARKVIIEQCQVCNVQGDGFFLRNVADAVVKECQAESNGTDGFVFDNCDISTITGCKAERNGLHGFEELACNGDNAYRSCTARQNGVHGFRIIGAGKIVEDCISNQNTLDGFNFVTPKNSTVDGSPDITFGTNGMVTTNIGIASVVNGMALQKDGKIVAVGTTDNGGDLDFAVARYSPDGSLDSSFGVAGVATTSFGGNDQAHAVAIQENGKLVVVGYSDAPGSLAFALARYNIDGSLDPDFNQGSGLIVRNISPFDDGALSVVIQEDGKIVVGGAADMGGGNFDFAVLRFTPQGQLDTTFNGTGIVTTDFGGMFDVCFDLTLQSDGKIVLAGFSDAGGTSQFALARYNTDGSLDTSFNPMGALPGTVTTLIGTQAQGQAVTVQKDGKIVVAGVADVGTPYFALARYNIDGSLDSSFGGTGTVTDSFAGAFSIALSVAIQTDGKINAIGYMTFAGQTFVGLMRYTTEGILDAGFNGGVGAAIIGTGSGYTQANAGLLDAQGRLLVAGDDGSPATDFFLARVNIFKRCSMIKDSTAQANGRDGFNLEDAYNVAVLGNQASCNTRNGFIAGSPTANNLYNNLSYDNTANYISATDLTVKPDEISSYWANVDPDKSVFDCNVCSLIEVIDVRTREIDSEIDALTPCIEHTCSMVDVIEDKVDMVISQLEVLDSKTDVIDGEVSVIDSKLDALTPCINDTCSIVEDIDSKVDVIDNELSIVDSKVDALQDTADIIESLVEVIDTKTQEIDSEIDALTPCIEHTCSVVDVIEDKVDVATSIAEEIESKTDVIDSEVSVIDSKVDAIDDQISVVDSKVDVIDSEVSVIDSKLDALTPCINDTCSIVEDLDSKLDVIDNEISIVDSKVDALQDTADIIESLVEIIDTKTQEIDSEIDALAPCIEHTCSVVDVIEEKVDVATSIAEEIESKTDVIDSEVSVIDSKVDAIDDQISVVDSKVDVIDSEVSVIDSKLDALTPCINDTCSIVEDLDSKLDVIDNEISIVDSKVDALQDTADIIESLVEIIDTKTQEIDSEIDALAPCIEHTCSVVDVIEDKVDVATSIAEEIESKTDVIDSEVSVIDSKVDAIDDQISVVDSKVDVIDSEVSVIDSKLDALTPCINDTCSIVEDLDSKLDVIDNEISIVDSKVDALQDTADIIESLVEIIDTKTQEIDSEIDALAPCIEHTCSVVDVIEDKVDVATSIAEEIESKTDVIDSEVSVIDSKIDAIDDQISVVDSKVDILIARDCCDCEHFIYQADIPYVITEPGIYCLAESVTNTGLNDFLITVSSSDVVIELGEHLMDGGTQNGSAQGAANGIVVRPGVQNITIRNGTLVNFASHGIYAAGGSDDAVQSPIRCLNFSNIKIANLSQFLPSIVDQPDQLNSLLDTISGDTGFDKILEAGLAGQLDISHKPVGIYIDYANQVVIANCEVVQAYGDGFFLRYVQEATVQDCQSNNNGGNGFVFDNCDVSVVSESSAEQNGFNGFYDVASNGDNAYSQCTAKQNGEHGFRVVGGGKTIENCIASQNTLDGFYVVTPKDSTVDGSLDITFGEDGKVTTDFNSSNDQSFATVVVQPDRKVVVAGFTTLSGNTDFALARYNIDGALDTSFNATGKVITDFGGADQCFGLALQQDGKIVAVGSSDVSNPGVSGFALARYNTNGSLDISFGGTGKITTNIGEVGWANAVAVQEDGKIIAAGFFNADLALVRYNSDGSLDTIFGVGGIARTSVSGGSAVGQAVEIQSDGRIVVGGYLSSSSSSFMAARYNLDGSLDTTFGTTGVILTSFGGSDDQAYAIRIQKDGKIVAAGYTDVGGNYDFALARYNSDGSLDLSFNGSGKVITDIGGTVDQASSLVIQQDGKLIAVGTTNKMSSGRFALARYNTGGSLDLSFNGSGIVISSISGFVDQAHAAALQQDGKLVAAGRATGVGGPDFAVARYNIFGRCSSIRESIAQANGRDGFNLENAFNVALLNSEASCNERNGFLGSSSTANNLYSNISYNNSTNYYSVTDLTVEPNSISSYWGNVEPDKSTPDIFADKIMSTNSIAEDIDSKVDALQDTADIIQSLVELIDCGGGSGDIGSCCEDIQSVLDLIDDKVDAIDSKIDTLTQNACCACEYLISQADIPYVITQPGIYCLAESVQNTGLNDFLITVSSSNVVLDLKQHMMDGGTQAGLSEGARDAIVVYPGLENVTIKNGTIANFAQYGINASSSLDANVQTPISCLAITDIKFLNLNEFLLSVVDQPDAIASRIGILELILGFDKIYETDLGDLSARVKKAAGMYIDYANKVTVKDCQAFGIQGDGFYFRYVQDGIIAQCQAERNGGNGFVFENCDVSCIESCKAEQNGFNGFHEIASNGDNQYEECTAKQNGVHGFKVVGGGKIIDSCVANQNTLDGFNMITPQALTVDGSLDITFDGDGKKTIHFGAPMDTTTSEAQAVAIQKDGKIVTAGYTTTAGVTSFAIARQNPDGSLDSTFGVSGKTTVTFPGSTDSRAFGVAIQDDGKIVVAGYATAGNKAFAVIRLTTTGSLDTTFNGTGRVLLGFGGTDDEAQAVALQQDGKIVVAGFTNAGGSYQFAIARFTTSGALDMGTVTAIGTGDQAYALAIQDNGKIVIAGFATLSSTHRFGVVRYNVDGSLDSGFGTSGIVTTSFTAQDEAYTVALQKDGKIVVAGLTNAGGGSTFDIAVARYNTDGTLDTSFNGDGKVTIDVDSENDDAHGMVIQKDGKIVLVGTTDPGTVSANRSFEVVRLDTDGALDPSFDVDGKVIIDFGSTSDMGYAIALQQDGKLVVAGSAFGFGNTDFAIARCNVFMRCSSIRNCIAQANGRNGFDLTDATEVAVLDNEASCNSGLGFVSSSANANTVLQNLAYDNTINFSSATDLLFAPNLTLNPLANIDPTSTAIDPLTAQLNSMQATINSILSIVSVPVIP